MFHYFGSYEIQASIIKKIVAAFPGMHVSPAKHSLESVTEKCDRRTERQTDRQTDGRWTK